MPTAYVCRLLVAAAVANGRHTAVATWLNTNLGANTVPADLGPGLSATGLAPPAYHWCNVALTTPQAKAVLSRLCTLAGVATPTAAQWDDATPAQRRTWWDNVRGAVWTNFNVWCQLAANDGAWDDPDALLAARGVRRVEGA